LRYEAQKLNLDPSLVFDGVAWNFNKAVAERDARIAELEKALKPFAHPDLSEVLSGNCKGDDSPVFQRDKAMLLIGHFRKARKALGKGE
jgi:hypothetical protein